MTTKKGKEENVTENVHCIEFKSLGRRKHHHLEREREREFFFRKTDVFFSGDDAALCAPTLEFKTCFQLLFSLYLLLWS